MYISLIQRPILYFYYSDTGNFIDKCDYISTYNEHYDKTLYTPYENNISLTSNILDDDLFNIIKDSKYINMYAVFNGVNANNTEQIKIVYKYTGITINSISYELKEECEMADFYINLLALNKIRVSDQELPNKIYKEMKENE